jgi:broad specificity phosphatase PhoE
MAKTYYIFRHGLTYAVKTGTAYGMGLFTAPIIDEAKPALERMGKFLKDKPTDFNISSPLTRCRQTVEIISKMSGKEFVFDRRITEFFLETGWLVRRRVGRLLKEIDKKGYEKVAICTHGAIISTLINALTPREGQEREYDVFRYPDPGVLVVIEDGKVEEINFNILT